MATSKSLAELLDENKEFISLTENGLRIKCLITPHEMPPRADAVQAYLTSAKFKKAKEWYSQDFSKYEPFLVRDKKSGKKLFCRITRTRVNMIPADVEKHVNGKRFLRLKQNYLDREAKRESGIGEDEDEEDDDDEEDAEGDEEDGDGGADDDIDVDEEAAAAAAAGVWMPKEELNAIVSGFKVKKTPKLAKRSKTEVVDEMDEGEEEEGEGEDEEEGADSDAGDEEASVNSEDSDIHLYIREAPPKPVIKAKALAKGKGKGKAKGDSDANGKRKGKSKSKSKSEGVHTVDVAETEPGQKRAAASQIKGTSKKVRN